jgi:hypothetical protein
MVVYVISHSLFSSTNSRPNQPLKAYASAKTTSTTATNMMDAPLVSLSLMRSK